MKKLIGSAMGASVFSLAFSFLVPVTALAAGPAAVNLGSAAHFAILAKTGVSTTGSTAVLGDLGVSPAAASYITGFGLMLPAAGTFSTSAGVTGNVYASDYAAPTPSTMTTAVLDMQNAYTDAAGRAPTATELGAGNIGGLTLAPGVYKWSTGVVIPTDVTLSGSANDTWIFQVGQDLTVSSGAHVVLSGGAQAANIFWQVAGQTTIGTTAAFNGTILDQTAVVLNTGATLNGRALAQTAVTLNANNVSIPSGVVVSPTPTPTPSPNPSSGGSGTTSGSGSTVTTTTTSNPTTTSSTQITLGNGQIVRVDANGNFTDTSGVPLSNSWVNGSTAVMTAPAQGQPVRGIAVDLMEGSRSNGVATLQQFLIAQNKGSAARALGNVGATAYFGTLTRAALAEFQANVGISPALGNFGPITRAYLSTH